MTRRMLCAFLALATLIVVRSTVFAHHSLAAEFDTERMVTITGTISEMKWTNPHAWLYIDVKDEKGQLRNWAVEFGSPNALYRRGWRQTDLPPKDTVTVTGYPSLDKALRISATDVKLPDGRTLFAGNQDPSGR